MKNTAQLLPMPIRQTRLPDAASQIKAIACSKNGLDGYDTKCFIRKITIEANETEQGDVYALLIRCIRSFAGQSDLDGENAYVIEECLKICDIMGWRPVKERELA